MGTSFVAAIEPPVDVRREEHMASGLLWLDIAHGFPFDLSQPLECQLPHRLPDARGSGARAGRITDVEE